MSGERLEFAMGYELVRAERPLIPSGSTNAQLEPVPQQEF